MRTFRSLHFAGVVLFGIAGYAQQNAPVKIKAVDIGGVVSSSKGPEAGVWVIAETTDLPTRYIKEVVTDDRGRYLIPDLPKAKYTVWARGYGLVDSPKVQTEPGKLVDLKPTVAPDAKTAAQLYPANYWYAMLKVPEKNEFPGTGPSGNGISPNVKNQGQWIHLIKTDSCESCHQLGNAIHAHHSADVQQPRFSGAGLGAPRAIRTGRQRDDGRPDSAGLAASHRGVWRLDHPHRAWRTARRSAAAAAGRRAQRRDHAVGLGRSEGLSARRNLDRQAQSERQRQRPDLRIAGREPRLSARARSGAQHHQPGEDSVPRSEHAGPAEAAAAVADLGRRSDLGQPHHGSQSDVRSARAPVVHVANPRRTPIRRSAKQGRAFLRRSSRRSRARAGSWRVYDPATKQTLR